MNRMLRTVIATALLGGMLPAAVAVSAPEPAQDDDRVGHEMLKVTNDMWFLLSGINNRSEADAAAARFVELVKQAAHIGDSLYDDVSHAQEVEALNMLHYRIAEVYEALSYEFDSLCRTHCYGSQGLISAFRSAIDAGIFDDEYMTGLELPKPPLNETEARHELVRMKRLVEPDRAVLGVLQEVTDAGSAAKAASVLIQMTERLRALLPEQGVEDRRFADVTAPSVRTAYAPIEPLLWGIRSEIVRIASLPGYDDEPYDAFSDALDSVFQSLADTHRIWFDDIFDASFRADLDEALHENATTSN